jgi:hypothetical protein
MEDAIRLGACWWVVRNHRQSASVRAELSSNWKKRYWFKRWDMSDTDLRKVVYVDANIGKKWAEYIWMVFGWRDQDSRRAERVLYVGRFQWVLLVMSQTTMQIASQTISHSSDDQNFTGLEPNYDTKCETKLRSVSDTDLYRSKQTSSSSEHIGQLPLPWALASIVKFRSFLFSWQ